MSYENAKRYAGPADATAAVPSQGLVSDAGTLPARLVTVLDRVRNLKVAVHGHQPENAAKLSGGPSEPSHENVRRFIDRSHALLSEIEDELSNIEQRL